MDPSIPPYDEADLPTQQDFRSSFNLPSAPRDASAGSSSKTRADEPLRLQPLRFESTPPRRPRTQLDSRQAGAAGGISGDNESQVSKRCFNLPLFRKRRSSETGDHPEERQEGAGGGGGDDTDKDQKEDNDDPSHLSGVPSAPGSKTTTTTTFQSSPRDASGSATTTGLWDLNFDRNWLARNGLDLMDNPHREAVVAAEHKVVKRHFLQQELLRERHRDMLARTLLPPLKLNQDAGLEFQKEEAERRAQPPTSGFDWGNKSDEDDHHRIHHGVSSIGPSTSSNPSKKRRRRRRHRTTGRPKKNKIAPAPSGPILFAANASKGDDDDDDKDKEKDEDTIRRGISDSRQIEAYDGDTLWVAHMDQEAGVPVFVNTVTDQRTFDAPSVGFRWKGDEEEFYDPEGLGEDFEDTKWVRPSFQKAMLNRQGAIFRRGLAPIWSTRTQELGQMGEGIQLYFDFLWTMMAATALSTVVYVPTLFLAANGSAIPLFSMDLLKFARVSVGNIGPLISECMSVYTRDPKCQARLNTTRVHAPLLFNTTLGGFEIAAVVGVSDLIVTLIFVVAGLYFQHQVRVVTRHAKQDFVTPRDYAVKVTGLPKSTESLELCDHFSRLFAVGDLPARVGSHSLSNGAKLRPVADVSNSEDSDYINSWVAESAVVSVYDCHSVRRHRQTTRALHDVKRSRAVIKSLISSGVKGKRLSKAQKMLDKTVLALDRAMDLTDEGTKIGNGEDACAAFVTFNHMESAKDCVRTYNFTHRWPVLSHCFQARRLRLDLKHYINVSRAPAPTDIIWENLDMPKGERCRRRFLTTCVATVIVLCCLLACAGFNGVGNWFEEEFAQNEPCEWDIPATFHNVTTPQPDELFGSKFPELEKSSRFDALCRAQYPGTVGLEYSGAGSVGIAAKVAYSMEACSDRMNTTAAATTMTTTSPLSASINSSNTTASNLTVLAPATTTITTATSAAVVARVRGLACPDPRVATQCPCVNTTGAQENVDHHKEGEQCPTTECLLANQSGVECEASFPENMILMCYCSQDFVGAIRAAAGLISWSEEYSEADERHPCGLIGALYVSAKVLDLCGDLVVNIVNIILGVTVGWLATRVDRHSSVSKQTVSVAYKTYIFMVINTAVIELVTKGTMPFTLPPWLTFLPGFLDGEHKDFTRSWYAIAGGSMTTTMLVEALLGPVCTAIDVAVCWPCRKSRLQRRHKHFHDARVVMQAELNKQVAPRDFDVAGRFASILNTMMITLIYCGGLPMLMPIALLSFGVSYWLDKWLLLRYYKKPVALDSKLLFMGVNQLWLAICLHLAFTIWMHGSEGVLSSPHMHIEAPDSGELFWETVWSRLTRQNTLVHSLLLALFIFVYCAGRVLGSAAEVAWYGLCHSVRAENKHHNPLPSRIPSSPFTEEFCRDVRRSKRGRPLPLTKREKEDGWVLIKVDGHQVRCKLFSYNGEFHRKGDKMLTWEVIEEANVFSYHLHRNPRYTQAVIAMEEVHRRRSTLQAAEGMHAAKTVANMKVALGRKLDRARSTVLEEKEGAEEEQVVVRRPRRRSSGERLMAWLGIGGGGPKIGDEGEGEEVGEAEEEEKGGE